MISQFMFVADLLQLLQSIEIAIDVICIRMDCCVSTGFVLIQYKRLDHRPNDIKNHSMATKNAQIR